MCMPYLILIGFVVLSYWSQGQSLASTLADHATGFVTVPVDDVLAAMHSEEG